MKKNIAIIILSVCLALTVIISVVLCLYLPHRQARLAEQVWAEYLSWLDYIDYDSDLNANADETRYPTASIMCFYSQAFDASVPASDETNIYTPWGNYVYDIRIYDDGSGILFYQQWGNVKTQTEDGSWTTYEKICYHKSETALTAEEVQSVLTVMEQQNFERIPTQNLFMYYTLDASPTFITFDCSLNNDRADWKNHLITEYGAEAGSPCYEIRKAIENLIIAHDAGPIPTPIKIAD